MRGNAPAATPAPVVPSDGVNMGPVLALGVFRCGAQNCDAIGGMRT